MKEGSLHLLDSTNAGILRCAQNDLANGFSAACQGYSVAHTSCYSLDGFGHEPMSPSAAEVIGKVVGHSARLRGYRAGPEGRQETR